MLQVGEAGRGLLEVDGTVLAAEAVGGGVEGHSLEVASAGLC